MEITTTVYYTRISAYGIVPSSGQYIIFDIKSCSDAFVLLSASPNLSKISNSFYEFGFGVSSDLKFSFRRKSGGSNTYIKQSGHKLLNCIEYRSFWISWNSGDIRLGKGNAVNFRRFYQYNDTNPIKIEEVGIKSVHNGSTADWKFNTSSNSKFCFLIMKLVEND